MEDRIGSKILGSRTNASESQDDKSEEACASELAAIYKSLDAVDQRLLLAVGREYISNTAMRERILDPKRPLLSFRLMDLPVELRVAIAEYAMAAGHSLGLRRLSPPGSWGKRGRKVDGIDELTALSRSSRQLYAETSQLVWKVNTFRVYDGSISDRRWTEQHTLLLRNIPVEGFGNLRSIDLMIRFSREVEYQHDLFKKITELARKTPAARLAVYDKNWVLQHRLSIFKSRYYRRGHQLKAFLGQSEFDITKRNWRLYPYQGELTFEIIKTMVNAADLEMVWSWQHDGL
ncbi:hypothetical protein FB567DRAFT_599697 [Paraphoma chrysanthemicola]|uniref:F-box domain-containing protein n=1 Tax=Paraphoma chrysanthemicola TaxID=798071 RepID=A0A8K0QSJ1_9PLEO|nr:hypothetical protein FB567DRAFT_599697 [Paraphoma chrysanthemicola]